MRKIILSFFLLVALPMLMFAQQGYYRGGGTPESNVISIFSENGDYFFVVINGVTQNLAPQTSIRIEGVTQPVNDVQIMFADNRTREIRRTVNVANPVDMRPVVVSMKIVRERDGDVKLHFVNCAPREHEYQPVQGEYLMFYGQDLNRQVAVRDFDHGREQYGNNGVRGDVVVREATVVNQAPPPPPVPVGPSAMDDATFQSVKQSIASNSFDDTKLSTAKMIANNNYFTVDQVIQICGLFSFEDTKLNFAKFAYKRTIDNNSYFRVNDVFAFDASKQALNDYISHNR